MQSAHLYSSTLFRVSTFSASRYSKDRITALVSNSSKYPYGRQLRHYHEGHEERHEHQHHRHGFQLSPAFHRRSGHGFHHESHERPECETSCGSFPRPSCGPSEDSFPRPAGKPVLPRGQVVKVFCKADPNFSLAIREGSVVLVHGNPSDKSQKWVEDLTYSTRVKDEDNCPSFSLVNTATGQALKHGLGETQPDDNWTHTLFLRHNGVYGCIIYGGTHFILLLTVYQPNTFDESTLWTKSGDIREGYATIRLVNNIQLNWDAYRGDKRSGGIKDGDPVILWSWKKGDNQLWKIVPH